MSWSGLIVFAGGIGLFLLGMRLMSDGLKIAAGPALRNLLASATRSPARGIASGVLITALVQSSSAVIFATIGFVNAGLLNLGQAVGVIFGANVGTTLTSWIVALVGFNVDLQRLAMPAVAAGMGLWISGGGRRAALGQALTGFGIFFLGLDVLKDSFAGLGDALDLHALGQRDGVGLLLLYTALGIVLTVLMQSSSAALAVTLTAAAGGLIPLAAAAAMVIGAKVGTTSTAAFAVFGATPAAKRSAAAHVIFSLVTAAISLPLLPWLLALSRLAAEAFGLAEQPATLLAIFHTLTALLGLLAIWPLTGTLVRWLGRRFGAQDADEGLPHHLDRHIVATPRLAIDALAMELRRMGAIAHRMARAALSSEAGQDARLLAEQGTLERLGEAVIEYAGSVHGGGDPLVDGALPQAVRVAQYFRGMAERALELVRTPSPGELPVAQAAAIAELRAAADQVLAAADPQQGPDLTTLDAAQARFDALYPQVKGELLRAGSRGEIGAAALVRALDRASALRRLLDQAGKAARYLARLGADTDTDTTDTARAA